MLQMEELCHTFVTRDSVWVFKNMTAGDRITFSVSPGTVLELCVCDQTTFCGGTLPPGGAQSFFRCGSFPGLATRFPRLPFGHESNFWTDNRPLLVYGAVIALSFTVWLSFFLLHNLQASRSMNIVNVGNRHYDVFASAPFLGDGKLTEPLPSATDFIFNGQLPERTDDEAAFGPDSPTNSHGTRGTGEARRPSPITIDRPYSPDLTDDDEEDDDGDFDVEDLPMLVVAGSAPV